MCEGKDVYPIIAVGCVLIALISFIFLLCSAGHRKGREEITPSVLTAVHFDILAVFFAGMAFFGLFVICSLSYSVSWEFVFGVVIGCGEIVWGTICCIEWAIRL